MTRPIHVGRAPGRLDIMGGNDDYTGGLVFEATIREATWAAIALRGDCLVHLHNPQMLAFGWQDHVEFRLNDLSTEQHVRELVNQNPVARWTAYVLGVFYYLHKRYPEKVNRGADVYIRSDVPLNKGVSSSAAVEVAVMKTAAHAYGIHLCGIELAEACQWVENTIAESACGIMDQIAIVLGNEACVLPVRCQPCTVMPLVPFPEDLACWGIDSGVSRAITGVEYEAARAAAFMGYKLICDHDDLPVHLDADAKIPRWTDARWNGYLSNLSLSLFRSRYESLLPETMTGAEYLEVAGCHVDPFTEVRPELVYKVRACTRYAVEENARVELFVDLAHGGARGFRQMGQLMYQSHVGYTECGLGCDATDLLVNLVRASGPAKGLFGARVTGGGAGGTVAVLGSKNARPEVLRIMSQYEHIRGYKPYLFEGSSIGADKFGVDVFPA